MRLKLQEYNAQSCSIVVKGLGRYSWSRFITCIHAELACEPVAKWPIMGHLRHNNNSNNYRSEHLGSQANQINIYFFCTKMVFGERSLGRRVWCILLCTIEKDMLGWLYYIYLIIILGPVQHAEIVEEDPRV